MTVYYYADPEARRQAADKGGWWTPAYIPCLLTELGVTAEPLAPGAEPGPDDVVFAPAGTELPPCKRVLWPVTDRKERGVKGVFDLEGVRVFLSVPLTGEPVSETEDSLTFGFDLPGQLWFAGDGFPRPPQNFFVGRIPDAVPVDCPDKAAEPYNAALLRRLARTLRKWGVPMFAPLPPLEGLLPDVGLTVSGDDDACSADINLEAGSVMNGLGIRYHINAMPTPDGKFIMSREDYDTLRAMGTETALHLDLTVKPEDTPGETRRQAALFESYFGDRPVTNCNHCLIQVGECDERLEALAAAGVIADNSKNGDPDPEDINGFDMTGFGFGFIHPRYTLNRKGEWIDCMEIPQNYYEPRVGGKYGSDTEKLRRYFAIGEKYMGVCQLFIHPHYLCSDNPHSAWSVAALRAAKGFLQGKRVWQTTVNDLAVWWRNRRLGSLEMKDGAIAAEVKAPSIVLLPEGFDTTGSDYPVRTAPSGLKYVALQKPGRHEIPLRKLKEWEK